MKILKYLAELYHRSRREAAAKLAAELQAQRDANMAANAEEDYYVVAEMLMQAVNNTGDATGFKRVEDMDNIMADPWLRRLSCGEYAYVYRARCLTPNSVTAKAVERILQAELRQICRRRKYPPLTVNISFGASGAVAVQIAFTADLCRAQQRMGMG